MGANDQTNLTAHPTLLQRVGLDYYHKPTNPIAQYVWRTKVWVGATFVMGMLEPLEVLALGIVFSLLTILFYLSLYKYFPAHWEFLRRRSAYYLYGDEMTPVFTLTPGGVMARLRAVGGWVQGVLGLEVHEQTREQVVDGLKRVVGAVSSTVSSAVSQTTSQVVTDTRGVMLETTKAEL
ncbi:hypothetical protein QFC21_004860 [Naganishia friedmannii]|uniref:Uncharacterized protein n=1 Tax=Naganishia friedmannii TaxID=89922 RepID=A0ACC2VDP8_9TREE|nr:hypothetical protein QFC21_004860 [Naganishia friedmannii]